MTYLEGQQYVLGNRCRDSAGRAKGCAAVQGESIGAGGCLLTRLGRKGLKDEEIEVLLRRLRQPTFFTRDLGFYTPDLDG